MQVEELELEFGGGKHLALESPQRPDEEWIHVWIESSQRTCDGETRIEMSAGAATGENNAHPYARSIANDGSVARPPMTFSRVLPMFTMIPVINIDKTRFDLPYEMNGSVSPVVGSSPTATPM